MKLTISPEASKLADKYGYLPYMVERYLHFLGKEETMAMLEANEKPLTPTIRINTLKIASHVLQKRLEIKGFELIRSELIPYACKVIKEGGNLGSTHEYLQGYYHLQGLASMLAPEILEPAPNEVVIDMAAAPGSKATQLAQLMENKGKLILIEKNKQRIPSLQVNIRRLGIKNALILLMDSQELGKLNLKADKILLDVPCTGEGLVREDSSRKRSRKMEDIYKMANIQKKLLRTGLNSLTTGGKLLYSTCSIAPEENELIIHSVLNRKSHFSIEPISSKFGTKGFTNVYGEPLREDLKNARRLFPHLDDTIGFFLCLIRKL